MRIIFCGNGLRGESCLKALHQQPSTEVVGVIISPNTTNNPVQQFAELYQIPCFAPEDINAPEVIKMMQKMLPDLITVVGYGQIFKSELINLPSKMVINLHGGKLPERRGSSPMNWALINGKKEFTLSAIKLDSGVDTGEILAGRTMPIGPNDTINDLHAKSHDVFPELLLEVIAKIHQGNLKPIVQNNKKAAYYPLRRPDDGFLLWDQLTAQEIHNQIRALTEPYPCAFTFYNKRKVKLISSEIMERDFFGEPGRIYQIAKKGLLVAAKDRSLWITEAKYADTNESIWPTVQRYDSFLTIKSGLLEFMKLKESYENQEV